MNVYEFNKVIYKGNINRDFYLYCLKKNKRLIKYLFINIWYFIISTLFISKKDLYAKNKSFGRMSIKKQQEFMMPFKVMDLMEAELRNLDIVNTSDNMSNSMKIVRRSEAIQKDFFSMAEYLV